MTACEDAFIEFIDRLALSTQQVERAESALSGLKEYLSSAFELDDDQIFLQGSYATGTAIRPRPGGEYDVDIVAVTASQDDSTNNALNTMAERLRESPRYAERVEPKTRCVRLRYADQGGAKFHIDVVPLKNNWSIQLQSPVRSERWKDTNPREFAEWSQSFGEQFTQVTKIAKRWRDEQQAVRAAIKSILLQVLIGRVYVRYPTIAETIVRVFEGLHAYLSEYTAPPVVINPRMASENLAERWSEHQFERFKKQVATAADLSRKAYSDENEADSQLQWKEVFGTSFPAPKPKLVASATSISLAEKYIELPSKRGWMERPDSRYAVTLKASVFDADERLLIPDLQSDGELLRDDWYIKFRANFNGPLDVGFWWQVLNTGTSVERVSTRNAAAFRGDFFRAKEINGDASTDPAQNWERTEYSGQHWIQCILVKATSIVARSNRFYVNIKNRADS